MNTHKTFQIYDSKAEAHIRPMYFKATGEAVRWFDDVVNGRIEPMAFMAMHPEDYTLFETGEWSEFTGRHEEFEAKRSLGNGLDYVATRALPIDDGVDA